jgi:hypothetical protein
MDDGWWKSHFSLLKSNREEGKAEVTSRVLLFLFIVNLIYLIYTEKHIPVCCLFLCDLPPAHFSEKA